MSHVADRMLLQDATLWSVTPDGYGGDVFGAPVACKCRWEDRTEKFMSPLDRVEQVSRSIVYLDRRAAVGDYLYGGTSADDDPTQITGAYKIRRFDVVPNLRNLQVIRKAYL
jgi:hypothetical protein